jgi:hypothetical protein
MMVPLPIHEADSRTPGSAHRSRSAYIESPVSHAVAGKNASLAMSAHKANVANKVADASSLHICTSALAGQNTL